MNDRGTRRDLGVDDQLAGLAGRIAAHRDAVVNELVRKALRGLPGYEGSSFEQAAADRGIVTHAARAFVAILAESERPLWEEIAPPDVLQAERLPTSLRQFLDEGGSLDGSPFDDSLLDQLAELVFLEVLGRPPRARAAYVEDCLQRARTEGPLEAIITGWAAEMAADEGLARRVRDALPTAVRDDVERSAARAWTRFDVKVPERWWTCARCHNSFDEGDEQALIVGEHEEWSFCGTCVAGAAGRFSG